MQRFRHRKHRHTKTAAEGEIQTSDWLRLPVVGRVAPLLGDELEGVPCVDPDAGAGVARLHPRQLTGVPGLEKDMLDGVHGAQPGLLGPAGAGRLLVIGHVAIGQPLVLVHVPGAQRLVRRQMLLRQSAVIVHVPVFHPCMLSRMTVDEPGSVPRVFKRHWHSPPLGRA
jgi:hypothetical protein